MAAFDVALLYAQAGLPVFPCGADKAPAIGKHEGGRGFLDATTDEGIIGAMFGRPNAVLVGVPTGERSGFFVLDIDYRHGGGDWEDANADRLEETPTRQHRTQHGGRHYLYQWAPGVRNSAAKIAPGVDVRGEGGYVIMPSSPGYEITCQAAVAPCPDWLLRLILARPASKDERPAYAPSGEPMSSRRIEGYVQWLLDRVRTAPDGAKHVTLRDTALLFGGILDQTGLSDNEAAQKLIDALPASVQDWKQAAATAEWGIAQGRARPFELPDRPEYAARQKPNGHDHAWTGPEPRDEVPPVGEAAGFFDPWAELSPPAFPIEALPSVLRAFVEDRARAMGADPCGIAWAALAACSAAIPGSIRLRMKKHDTWSVPPALWVALIGESALAMKTPIIDAAFGPLSAAQAVDMEDWKERLAIWRAQSKKERDATEQPYPRRRLISHDGTMEALQDILGRQNRGVGVLRDELAGWLGQLEKYGSPKSGAADRAFFLQAFNGGPHTVDRINRGTVAIENLLVTICGGIQPDRLRQFGDLTDDGLWQRFLPIIMQPAKPGHDEPLSDAVAAYYQTVAAMLNLNPRTVAGLTEAAHEVRAGIEAQAYELVQGNALGPRFASFCGKLPGLWGRLCLVLHYLDPPADVPFIVPHTAAERARILIIDCALRHAARVYITTGGAGADIEATRAIAGYILTKRKERVTAPELTRDVRAARHQRVARVQDLVSPLVAGGWLTPETEWHTRAWAVHPGIHASFAARAAAEAERRAAVRELILQSVSRAEKTENFR